MATSSSSTLPTAIILLLLLCACTFEVCKCGTNTKVLCNEEERQSLVAFKRGIVDPLNLLSSWSTEQDCCSWDGVECDNVTGRVIELDLECPLEDQSKCFRGQMPKSIWNFTSLESLQLAYNNLNGPIPDWLGQHQHLKYIDLSKNFFSGSIPTILANLSSLISLNLTSNRLNGSLPLNFSKFSNLENLEVAGNSLGGVLTEANFAKLSKLKRLELSSTSIILDLDPNWIPPFQILHLGLQDIKLGPTVPTWLYTQRSLHYLNIQSSGISHIDHDKFWKFAATVQSMLILSYNPFGGDISNALLNTPYVELQGNNLNGGPPRISPNVTILSISGNLFSRSLSSLLCPKINETNNLKFLRAPVSHFSGEPLPNDCWLGWNSSLIELDLSWNNLTGKIPKTIGWLSNLQYLYLGGNNFSGEIPASLQNIKTLKVLNLAFNQISGSIPNWMMGKNMTGLVLRSNQFNGTIPSQICQLSSLIVLDLSFNKLSGSIPKCLSNITTMVSYKPIREVDIYLHISNTYSSLWFPVRLDVVMKGQQVDYALTLVRSLDLSSNYLHGPVPSELFKLNALQSLNLSRNQFTGQLPQEIGSMTHMESLDLSWNQISHEIPQSISNISFLSVLNLSYNHFTGQIPLGTQLQSFEEYSYIGNPELCGAPLPKSCSKVGPDHKEPTGEDEDQSDMLLGGGFYIAMGVGFAAGFWGVCVPIFFKRSWRHAYFKFVDDKKDRLYVALMLKIKYFR